MALLWFMLLALAEESKIYETQKYHNPRPSIVGVAVKFPRGIGRNSAYTLLIR